MNIRQNLFRPSAEKSAADTSQEKKRFTLLKAVITGLKTQIEALNRLRKQSFISTIEKNYAFAMFITLIGLVYIFNSLHAEKLAAHADRLMKENKELKSEYMTLNAKISLHRRQSKVLSAADTVGLHLLNEPPFKLVYSENNNK